MTVVFKLGGSLLTQPNLAEKLLELIRLRSQSQCLFIVGGGASADVVREWSKIHQLSEETSHWLAIASLELNTLLIRDLLKWNIIESREQANARWSTDSSPLLLEMPEFARDEERRGSSIPHNWDVTSDSLAAWIAKCWPADELVLVKSVAAPQTMTLAEASILGLVDNYFPVVAGQLPLISWCNLRAPRISLDHWHIHSTTTT